ncbi:probable G-protein coupled receptor 82 [Amia ocellicauda]|uniref:probable G-protein coupled receptor 82 n=1 Tax=Amia ocellicauda TaxID=2972642 RepID=UPI0034647F65
MSITTPTHFYLTNLGVSNLLLCAVMPFLSLYYAQGYMWQSDTLICQLTVAFVTPVIHINLYVSMLILSWIALSRCATLMRYNEHNSDDFCNCFKKVIHSGILSQFRELRFAKMLCLGIWVTVIVAIVPVMVYYSIHEAQSELKKDVCYGTNIEIGGGTSQVSSKIASFIFFLCFLLVLVSYTSITRHIYKMQKSSAISEKHWIYNRVFRKILVIQVVLVVCFLPHHIFRVIFINLVGITQTCDRLSRLVEVKNYLLCLTAFRSSTDPLMYFLLDNNFKRHFKKVIKSIANKTSSQSSVSNLQGPPCISQTKNSNINLGITLKEVESLHM